MFLVELGSPWLFYYLTRINTDHILVVAVPIYSKMGISVYQTNAKRIAIGFPIAGIDSADNDEY